MGAWGISLYSNDFAQDLKHTVGAVCRLPFDPEDLLQLLRETQGSAASDMNDSDHTVFWLVVADQFTKRGVDSREARERALAIIADGADLKTMKSLGMDEKSLAKRSKMLSELAKEIIAPVQAKSPRRVLKAPQKLILEVGQVVVYPTCNGVPINPYAVGKPWEWVRAWKQDGWGALTVAERGLVFGFLAWYRALVVCEAFPAEPTLETLWAPRMWLLRNPGTLTKRHAENMQLTTVGRISIEPMKLKSVFPNRGNAIHSAVEDISLVNRIHVQGLGRHEAHRVKHGYPATPRVHALSEIGKREIG